MYNQQTIEQYLRFISGNKKVTGTYFNYCFLDANSKEQIKGYGVKYGTIRTILAELELLRAHKPTLHITLNAAKPTGRTNADIVSSRVLCVDLDNDTPDEAIAEIIEGHSPHLVVRSSMFPHKYHIYWKVQSIDLQLWSKLQIGLAYKFKGDLELGVLAKTIRVPGVERTLKTGVLYVPEIIYPTAETLEESGGYTAEPLTVDAIYKRWTDMNTCIAEGEEYKKNKRKEITRKMQAATELQVEGEARVKVQVEGRNSTLWNELYKYGLQLEGITAATIESFNFLIAEHAADLNATFDTELDDREVQTIINSVIKTVREKLIEKESQVDEPQEPEQVEVEVDPDDIEPDTSSNLKQKKASSKSAKKPKVDAALLEQIKEFQKVPTNGDGSFFEYDYSIGALAEGRFSTLGTVERVFQRYGKHIVTKGGSIYAFNTSQKIWERQTAKDSKIITQYVVTCCRDILRDEEFIKLYCAGENPAKKLKAGVEKYLGHSYMTGVKAEVLQDTRIRCLSDKDFDANEGLFYVANGVLDLGTGAIREAKAEDLLLRRSKVVYDRSAGCAEWLDFLGEIFSENEDPESMVSFMQLLFGYSLSGSIDAQKLFIHYGAGSNGKSKVMEALKMLLGDYASIISSSNITKSKESFNKELERISVVIESRRAAVIDDLDSKVSWNEGLVKNLTGRELTSRRLYEEETKITNRAKFHMGCNDKPVPQSENFGILRRMCIIPYHRQFEPDSAKEQEIMDMIGRSLSGILNWSIEGYRRFREEGFKEPMECTWSLEEYKLEHFTEESSIEDAFKKPETEAEKAKAKWYSSAELVSYVEKIFEKVGKGHHRVSAERIGRVLKNNLKAHNRRTREAGRRLTEYLVLKTVEIDEKELEKDLLSKLN